ncbi:MAG: Crp/Fnr family transcriptional regulator [Microcystis novacekii Mn_MB_F_20050700_S1]|uniref:Crp/Fnr family transcriptional regulator n=1 Tax=Microcystis novacekii Mn_MB_F_20050700_S1D TaxID=2486266 RepID=A0A552INR8_9CHRO|nr:MAG: Crp/Fnr family transcriptional regulator [Microcystis novacekii Mn_MB_F_20050700_S1D]TRU93662.1 MAG: Crp/Fnr family transcriptional regulator [Microcystis novacekii Mn_MB_F_20050700_S1]
MGKSVKAKKTTLLQQLINQSFLFRGLEEAWLSQYLDADNLKLERLFSNRPVYTAFLPDEFLDVLYVILDEGVIVVRSTPLDRIIAITYPGGCFGMRSLPFSYGLASRAFPCLVESYKTTHVLKIPLSALEKIYNDNESFHQRYCFLFELQQKFEYHLLNCSSYPPQAVATLLRALIYQERELGSQPDAENIYTFDLSVDVIARACQLNQRTVEQVLKGLQTVGLIASESTGDLIRVLDAEGLKEVYSATRDKVNWWPLR